MYCGHEIYGETVQDIIALATVHAKEEHGWTEEVIPPEMVALWRSRIRRVTASED